MLSWITTKRATFCCRKKQTLFSVYYTEHKDPVRAEKCSFLVSKHSVHVMAIPVMFKGL
jgi:hypothetical protein